MFEAVDFSPEQMGAFDAVAFGCPSMGAEQLEESEFAPMFTECEPMLSGKKDCPVRFLWLGRRRVGAQLGTDRIGDGAMLACDSVICNEAPDEDGVEACKMLGKALV